MKKIDQNLLRLLERLRDDRKSGELERGEQCGSVTGLITYLESYERTLASDAQFAERYPNLAKESEVKDQAQEVFQFLEFLAERGVNLAKYSDGDQLIWATHKNGKTGFIDDFYELDRKATEREREALLAAFIEQQNGNPPQVVQS